MRGPEGKIQDKILLFARKNDILYKKQEVGRFFVSSGWPDVIFFNPRQKWHVRSSKGYVDVLLPGLVIMEFKPPGGKPTPLQVHRHQELRERGFPVHVVDSVEQGCAILKDEFNLD